MAAAPSSTPDDAAPLVLTASVRNVQQVTAVNEAAAAEGLSPGMTLTHARALFPGVPSAPADPAADRGGLEKLADWCGRYSPVAGIDGSGGAGDDGLWIDASGCAHLLGGEAAMLADLGRRLASSGIRHRLGLAGTMGAAWALARYSPVTRIVEPGALGEALFDLPVAGLRLAPETLTLLRRLGLKRIGQLDGLPRAALGKRFSSKEACEAVLLRLDQIFGRQDEPLAPRRPTPVYRAVQGFLEPITELPALAHALERLIRELCRQLGKAGQGAERLALRAWRVDGDVKGVTVGASRPTKSPEHLERLFAERLATIDPGFGIEHLALHAEKIAALGAKQGGLAGGITNLSDRDERLAELIDRLAIRIGPEAVTVIVPFASHLPERAERHVSAMAMNGRDATPPCPSRPPRPSCLLFRPEPVKAMAEVPDGPPLRFTWRRVSRRIVRAEGPERIAPEWWRRLEGLEAPRETGAIRDYYRVEDEEGRRYWLFRAGLYADPKHPDPPRWFIHGLFG